MNLSVIKSEVERNIESIEPGMTIFYNDSANCKRYTVTQIEKDGTIWVTDDNGEEYSYYVEQLQFGWVLSSRSREYIESTKGSIL